MGFCLKGMGMKRAVFSIISTLFWLMSKSVSADDMAGYRKNLYVCRLNYRACLT